MKTMRTSGLKPIFNTHFADYATKKRFSTGNVYKKHAF
jgi:hypothetical protein